MLQNIHLVVIFKARPPAGRAGDGGVEDGEVDEGVGSHEEVGEEGGDDIEISDQHTHQAYGKHLQKLNKCCHPHIFG